MSTIQNLKNFIRHGKQAKQAHGDPTTNVSPVHAQQQRYAPPPPPPPNAQYAMSDPNLLDHKPLQHGKVPGGDFSVANMDNRNVVAQAGGAAARAAGDKQKVGDAGSVARSGKETDPSVIERIVAEERESQGKLPKYPGLERWTLLEKMGDGAFSNVYRAREANGHGPEVAIKVVRKFEMNSTQVSLESALSSLLSYVLPRIHAFPCCSPSPFLQNLANIRWCNRATTIYIRISRSNPRSWRCAQNSLFICCYAPLRFSCVLVHDELLLISFSLCREQIFSKKFRSCAN